MSIPVLYQGCSEFGFRGFLHPKTPTLFQIDPECYGSFVLKAKLTVPQNLEAHTNSSFFSVDQVITTLLFWY